MKNFWGGGDLITIWKSFLFYVFWCIFCTLFKSLLEWFKNIYQLRTKNGKTLGHLYRNNSKVFDILFPTLCVTSKNWCIKRYAKFRFDTCNATDAIQEKCRGGQIQPLPDSRRLKLSFSRNQGKVCKNINLLIQYSA